MMNFLRKWLFTISLIIIGLILLIAYANANNPSLDYNQVMMMNTSQAGHIEAYCASAYFIESNNVENYAPQLSKMYANFSLYFMSKTLEQAGKTIAPKLYEYYKAEFMKNIQEPVSRAVYECYKHLPRKNL